MGMFDSIYLEVKCPCCGKIHEVEAQTKELDCELHIWRKGDHLGSQHKKSGTLRCLASCDEHRTKISDMDPKPTTFDEYARRRGYSEYFDLEVFIENNIVTGKYEIINNERTRDN